MEVNTCSIMHDFQPLPTVGHMSFVVIFVITSKDSHTHSLPLTHTSVADYKIVVRDMTGDNSWSSHVACVYSGHVSDTHTNTHTMAAHYYP